MNAFEAAAASGQVSDLQAELETLFNDQNAIPQWRCHLDTGDVPARERCALSQPEAELSSRPHHQTRPGSRCSRNFLDSSATP